MILSTGRQKNMSELSVDIITVSALYQHPMLPVGGLIYSIRLIEEALPAVLMSQSSNITLCQQVYTLTLADVTITLMCIKCGMTT